MKSRSIFNKGEFVAIWRGTPRREACQSTCQGQLVVPMLYNMSKTISPNMAMKNSSESSLAITRPSLHSALVEEISLASPSGQVFAFADGVVSIPQALDIPLALARLVVPKIMILKGSSISSLATELFQFSDEYLDHTTDSWSLSFVEPGTVDTGMVHSRARLIEEHFLDLLEKRRRGIKRRLTKERGTSNWLLQVVLIQKDTIGVSISQQKEKDESFTRSNSYAANYITVADDKTPPSRAFKKLVEARLLWELPFRKDQHAVDLGACPGGWTHCAQSWGLSVTAIDRSPLAEHLMKSKRVKFIRGDAFTWTPEKRVDWLLCDVISAPGRTKELLQKWITEKLTTYFCVTMKFKGEPPVSMIHELKGWMTNNTKAFDVIPLTNNKNEITWVGAV